MKWTAAILLFSLLAGCSRQRAEAPTASTNPSPSAPSQLNSSGEFDRPSNLSEGAAVGRYVGIVPGSHGDSAALELRVDHQAILTFKGGDKPVVLKGSWKVWSNTVNAHFTKTNGKPEVQAYLFTMNKEGNVLAGSAQKLGEQGPMLSLKKE